MILDDYEIAQVPLELRRVLEVIGHEGGKCLLSVSELAERAKVPTWMMRGALSIGVEKGILRISGQRRRLPRSYFIEVISPPWLRYLTAATRGGRLATSA